MNCKRRWILAAALSAVVSGAGSAGASAQTGFRNYGCTDGTQFVMGSFQYDSRAHLQLDGKALTLTKRVALSGARYSGGGVTLSVGRTGAATLKRGKRPVTACELT